MHIWEKKKILTKLISMKKVLEKYGYTVSTGSTFCCFHDNTGTPSAKYYDDSNLWWCFAEQKHYTVWEALELCGQDPNRVFDQVWNSLTEKRRGELIDEIGIETSVELPYEKSLHRFKKNQITYQQLKADIIDSIDIEDIETLRLLYESSRPTSKNNYDEYRWLGSYCNLDNYREITDGEYITKVLKKTTPRVYITNFIKEHVEVLIIFNMVDDTPIGATVRATRSKAFIDINNKHGIFYGIGKLSEGFQYGAPITLTEGPKDCDCAKQLMESKDTLALMTGAVSKSQVKVLQGITNNIILALDNDNVGRENVKKFIKYHGKDFKISVVRFREEDKDFGDLIKILKSNYILAEDVIFNYKSQIELGGL